MGLRVPHAIYNSCDIAGSSRAVHTTFLFVAHRHRVVFLLDTTTTFKEGLGTCFFHKNLHNFFKKRKEGK